MGDLAYRLYPHRFYVDGDPVISDVKAGGSWRTALVGTTAAGGRSVFALDISAPAAFNGRNVMWEITSAAHPELGYTFGRPVIVPMQIGGGGPTWVAIFGNGYGDNATTDHPNDPYLFVVDMATGNVLRKIRGNDGSTAYNGLGQIAVIDRDGNGLADTVYGGDLQGNLWKFDLSSAAAATWNVAFGNAPLFRATDAGGMPQAITGDIEVASGPGGGVSVYFGSGRYFAENDNLVPPRPQIQSLYGVYDNGATPAGTRTNLVEQQIIAQGTNTLASGTVVRFRETTSNPVNYAVNRGFFMDLGVNAGAGPVATGEMFIGNPRVQSGVVFFTTYEPLGDPCTPGGRNWIYGLDLTTGGAALQNIRIDASGETACSGNCGAVAIAEGAPVTDTSIFIPRPDPVPGLTCVVGTPGCDALPAGTPPPLQRCTLVIRAPGSEAMILDRPCGRQSWRQVR
jgi:type IV pilus assembly protein PilY1